VLPTGRLAEKGREAAPKALEGLVTVPTHLLIVKLFDLALRSVLDGSERGRS